MAERTQSTQSTVSPVMLEIFRNRLASVCDEMIYALIRTAYSTNIKDRLDCSCAISNTQGEIIAQTQLGTPVHLGTMSFAARRLLDERGDTGFSPGDVFLFNSPYPEGPGHLPDLTLITPIYSEKTLLGLALTQAHNIDLGGTQPGSTPFGVSEIYQEGLQIPVVKLISGGEVQQDLFSLIAENVRVPKVLSGDLWAEVAANNTGQKRVVELAEKHGMETLSAYLEAILDYGEARMRAGLTDVPDGTYHFADTIEGDSINQDHIAIRVNVIKESDHITLDFRESDDQVAGPINCRPSMVAASTYFAVKSLVDPDLPANGGAYRPISIYTREGSLLEARYPAAVGNANGVTSQRIVDTVWGALAQALPQGVNAANAGTITGCTIGGYDPVRNRVFSYVETYGGGQGGMEGADGMSGVHTNMSNTRNSPVEVLENEYPFRVERYELIPDSGGPGTFRGGLGLRRVIRFLAGPLRITTSSDREEIGPWGLNGGAAGFGTKYYVETKQGRSRLPGKYSGTIENADTVLFIETAGGGGYGAPQSRDRSRIAADLEKGVISRKRAEADYGYEPDR